MMISQLHKNEFAVSSLVGAVLLLAIAISAFGVIQYSSINAVTSLFDEFAPNTDVLGSIPSNSHPGNSSTIFLQHNGGEELENWELLINGETVDNGTNFKIGETLKIEVNLTDDSIITLQGNDDNNNEGVVYNYYYDYPEEETAGSGGSETTDPAAQDNTTDPDSSNNDTVNPSYLHSPVCNSSRGCLYYNNSNLTMWFVNTYYLNPIWIVFHDPDIPMDLNTDFMKHSFELLRPPANNSRVKLQVTYSDMSLLELNMLYP